MDPRVTLDRHGLGEGKAVALTGNDFQGVRWRTRDRSHELLNTLNIAVRYLLEVVASLDDATQKIRR